MAGKQSSSVDKYNSKSGKIKAKKKNKSKYQTQTAKSLDRKDLVK